MKPLFYVGKVLGGMAIAMASLFAFVLTCVPVGMLGLSSGLNSNGLVVACVVGAVAAIFVGWLVSGAIK